METELELSEYIIWPDEGLHLRRATHVNDWLRRWWSCWIVAVVGPVASQAISHWGTCPLRRLCEFMDMPYLPVGN